MQDPSVEEKQCGFCEHPENHHFDDGCDFINCPCINFLNG